MIDSILSLLRNILERGWTTVVLVVVSVVLCGYIAWAGYSYLSARHQDEQIAQEQSEFRSRNPIITQLPYETAFYSISYDRVGKQDITIKIFTSSPYYRSQALQYLLRYDQEVTINHKIEFVDFKSPLSQSTTQEFAR